MILQENYEVRLLTNIGGWKHGFYELPARLHREVDCLICVKDPYAWLLSQYNFRHPKKDVSFETYLRTPLTVGRPPRGQVTSSSPVQLWVTMYQHWLAIDLLHRRKFVFRYEQVLADPEASIRELVTTLGLRRLRPLRHRIAHRLGIAEHAPQFFLPDVHLMGVPNNYRGKDIKRGAKFDADRYKKRSYLKVYTPELLDLINAELDQGLLDQLGYRRVLKADLQPADPSVSTVSTASPAA
ncbi:MAG TPA: hypothetical protein VH914_17290 [Acidimicrobiia bacterium]|nr:hypothetical protein [Acidimicrobiia bacterium]